MEMQVRDYELVNERGQPFVPMRLKRNLTQEQFETYLFSVSVVI